MRLEVSIVAERIELVDADAILLPVDGQIGSEIDAARTWVRWGRCG